MISEKLNIVLTDIGSAQSRKSVMSLIRKSEMPYHELNNFWSLFESNDNDITTNTIVFTELNNIVKHYRSAKKYFWNYKVKKANLYFFVFISSDKDEKLADYIDDLVKLSHNRITVLKSLDSQDSSHDQEFFLNELSNIISKFYQPDSLNHISYIKPDKTFLVEFNDGLTGHVALDELHLEDLEGYLLFESARISEQGNAVEILTTDGEIFDIDALVLKSKLSDKTRYQIMQLENYSAKNIGKVFRAFRKKNKITQKELSQRTDIDQAIISKIETGKHLPRLDTMQRIAEGMNTRLNDLFLKN